MSKYSFFTIEDGVTKFYYPYQSCNTCESSYQESDIAPSCTNKKCPNIYSRYRSESSKLLIEETNYPKKLEINGLECDKNYEKKCDNHPNTKSSFTLLSKPNKCHRGSRHYLNKLKTQRGLTPRRNCTAQECQIKNESTKLLSSTAFGEKNGNKEDTLFFSEDLIEEEEIEEDFWSSSSSNFDFSSITSRTSKTKQISLRNRIKEGSINQHSSVKLSKEGTCSSNLNRGDICDEKGQAFQVPIFVTHRKRLLK